MIGPIPLAGEAATQRLAQDIAMLAAPGWVIGLAGGLGAGKTTFARAFIRALARDPSLEVPSPTYTLAQRYHEADPPVLHADLYRIDDPAELVELGLEDPDDPAIRLVEWPGRAGPQAFPGAITLTFAEDGAQARTVSIGGPDAALARIARSQAIRAFLARAGQGDATRQRLQGDASTRRYERLGEAALILMDAPRQPDGPVVREGKPYSQLVHLAESVHAFAALACALRDAGFSAPAIPAADLEAGLLLVEDLGSQTILAPDGSPDPQGYREAVELLAGVHARAWPQTLPVPGGGTHTLHRYDTGVFLTEISLCPDWYVAHRGLDPARFDRAGFLAAWQAALAPLEQEPPTLTLRDHHSPNIIWRRDHAGLARVGLIDFQDALLGPPSYDIASLVQDARVTIPPALQAELLAAYAVASGDDPARLAARVALMGAQRNTKILGIFARLNARDGKPGYLRHLPRVEAYMRQCLANPALAGLRPHYARLLPEAT